MLTTATAPLNAHIHSQGLSAHEMFMQRDQFTNAQIPLSDQSRIEDQQPQRRVNHSFK